MDIDQIIAYENGELSTSDTLTMFAGGLLSGAVWKLQGHYGRTAQHLLDTGIIFKDSETNLFHVDWSEVAERI